MKEILLKEDGEINEEWLNAYLSSHEINKPFNKSRHTLLYAVVKSDDINPDKKLELVSYLINKGALVNNKIEMKGEIVRVAITQNDSDLANFLLKEEIKHKFDEFGLIKSDDVALVLAAKISKKPYKASIFSINALELPMLIEKIKEIIEKNTDRALIKFQIIYFHKNHANLGAFEIDKITVPPVVKYFHWDPAVELTEYSEVITEEFIEEITPLANIEIYDSTVYLQKTKGCSYFSIDGALMLATPTDRAYVSNVIEHMKANVEKVEYSEDKKIKHLQSHSLPARFIRGLQFDDKGDTPKEPNIQSFFNTIEKDTVVNKKGETAEVSMKQDLEEVPSKINPAEFRTFNYRAKRKMKQYGEAVIAFIKNEDLFSPEFNNLVDQYTIKGLVQFFEEIIDNKKRLGHS